MDQIGPIPALMVRVEWDRGSWDAEIVTAGRIELSWRDGFCRRIISESDESYAEDRVRGWFMNKESCCVSPLPQVS